MYQKHENFRISKPSKIPKTQSIILSTPDKLNATISKTSSQRLKLTIQRFRMENKEFKEKVMEFQQELSKSSLKVSKNLGEQFTSIKAGVDQREIPPYMKLFWEEQQKYIALLPRYSIQFCLSLTAKMCHLEIVYQILEKIGV